MAEAPSLPQTGSPGIRAAYGESLAPSLQSCVAIHAAIAFAAAAWPYLFQWVSPGNHGMRPALADSWSDAVRSKVATPRSAPQRTTAGNSGLKLRCSFCQIAAFRPAAQRAKNTKLLRNHHHCVDAATFFHEPARVVQRGQDIRNLFIVLANVWADVHKAIRFVTDDARLLAERWVDVLSPALVEP